VFKWRINLSASNKWPSIVRTANTGISVLQETRCGEVTRQRLGNTGSENEAIFIYLGQRVFILEEIKRRLNSDNAS
jgi:hypothetical protein